MKSSTVLGIYREQVFSPGKVQDDAAILDSTLAVLARLGYEVNGMRAESLDASVLKPDYVLSMAQSNRSLEILEGWQEQGSRVINSAESIRNCYRKPLIGLLAGAGVSMPYSRIVSLEQAEERMAWQFSCPIWMKRGDVHAMQSGDVVLLRAEEELLRALAHFRHHGIFDILLQEHVEGRVVKFYGVGEGEYFKAFLADTGEEILAQVQPLSKIAAQAARIVGLEVYGGDAVLTNQDEVFLIDLNDWPSFSRCCSTAAESIASYLVGSN